MTSNNGNTSSVVQGLCICICSARHTSGTDTGIDDALCTGIVAGGEKRGQHVLVGVQDGYGSQMGHVGEVKDGAADGVGGVEEEIGHLVDEDAELACFGRVKGVEGVCVHFGGVEGGPDAVIEHNHGAAVASGGRAGELDSLIEVQWAVGAEGCGGSHGADDDDGLGGVDGAFKEEGGFLEGVGAVGDNDARNVVFCELLIDHVREVQADCFVDVSRSYVGGLVSGNVGDVEQFRHRID